MVSPELSGGDMRVPNVESEDQGDTEHYAEQGLEAELITHRQPPLVSSYRYSPQEGQYLSFS